MTQQTPTGPTPSGYDHDIRLFATRYEQGARTVFSLDLSLAQIASLLPKPDPSHPTEGNRRVNERHAREFGAFVREYPFWIAPALVLRAPDIFTFEAVKSAGGNHAAAPVRSCNVTLLPATDKRL